MKDFEIAGGSVRGRDHEMSGRNNQDSYFWKQDDDLIVAAVCDGCGSGRHSEVGALLGARMLVKHAWSQKKRLGRVDPTRLRLEVVSKLMSISEWVDESLSSAMSEFFLFTSMVLVVDAEHILCLSCGDGVVAINGDIHSIDQANAPAYLGYFATNAQEEEHRNRFVSWSFRTAEIESFLVGTDGVDDICAIGCHNLPGKAEPVGPLSQFWTEDRYFKNPFAVTRRLALVNRRFRKVDYDNRRLEEQKGLLTDDTTLVAVRRCRSTSEDSANS